jgi:hypothetical protein
VCSNVHINAIRFHNQYSGSPNMVLPNRELAIDRLLCVVAWPAAAALILKRKAGLVWCGCTDPMFHGAYTHTHIMALLCKLVFVFKFWFRTVIHL